MRHIPGWVVGALGTAAIVASFYAGGALRASSGTGAVTATTIAAASSGADAAGLELACEPGQRAVIRQASATTPQSVACVSEIATVPTGLSAAPVAGVTRVAYTSAPSYTRPQPVDEPVEVYRPRAMPVSYEPSPARHQTRDVARPTRSVKKSAVIIAGSTAVGATIGGLTKGKKGALVGGLLGGGAAAVWDQVTRRRDDGR